MKLLGTLAAAIVVLATGCFDSLVDSRCETGFVRDGSHCVARAVVDGGADALVDSGPIGVDVDAAPTPDATTPPDALTCTVPEVQCPTGCKDLQTDPDNCGVCGHVCASGLCTLGLCVGEPHGHIIAIGHDYQHHHPAMTRVLGNAAALGVSSQLHVGWWPAGDHTASRDALAASLAVTGRPWTAQVIPATPSTTALTGLDVMIVDASPLTTAATASDGAAWTTELDAFLARGGVVIVVEGIGGTGHLFAAGAGLFVTGDPVDVTGQQTVLANPADFVADHVVTPYLAEGSSVSFPGAAGPVVDTTAGDVIVFHLTR